MNMSELAKLAGVSKSTVSRALAGSELIAKETRDKIRELAERHSYRMNVRARNFRQQKNMLTIGVLIPSNGISDWVVADPFLLEMLGSISNALEEKGHELLLAKHSNNDPSWIEDFARTRNVDGIIVLGQSLYHDILNEIAAWYKTMVVWGAEMDGQNYCTVGSDNYLGGRLAAEHLLEQGRTRFAFLGDIRYPETRQRYMGYRDTLKEKKVEYKSELTTYSENTSDNARHSISKLLEKSEAFDTLIAASDLLAISAIKAIRDKGLRVPQDIAVVGYDNITLAGHTDPMLTTISQDRNIAGRLLVEKLYELIGTGSSSNAIIPTELVCRESSGARPFPPI